MMNKLGLSIAALLMTLAPFGEALADTYSFPLEGRLTETNGKPVDGPVALSVAFYHVASGGAAILTLTDGLEHVALQEGVLQLRLTFSASDYHNVFSSVVQRVFVEITDLTHAPTTPYPRYEIGMTPYAGKIPVDDKTIAFGSDGKASLVAAGAATSGKILSADGAGGLAWIDPPAPTSAVSTGGQNGAFSVGTNDASAFTLETNNSPRMTIDAAGKVAFGTATTSGGDTTFSQLANGDTILFAKRGTDTAPTGKFIDFKNAASSSSLFSVGVDGGVAAGAASFSGKVGIGTINPSAALEVSTASGSNDGLSISYSADIHTGLRIGLVEDLVHTPVNGAVAGDTYFNSAYGSHMLFTTNDSGNSPLLALGGGKVGIGTATPVSLLSLNGVKASISLQNTNDSVTSGLYSVGSDFNSLRISQNTAAAGDFSTSNTLMSLAAGGGLTLASPTTAKAYVEVQGNGGAGNAAGYRIKTNGGSMPPVVYGGVDDGAASQRAAIFVPDAANTGTMEAVSILKSSGNVGIGTPAPTNLLDVRSGTTGSPPNTPQILIENFSALGGSAGIGFRQTDDLSPWNPVKTGIFATGSGPFSISDLSFVLNDQMSNDFYDIGADTRMIIKSSGKVGIGTVDPHATLEVAGHIAASGATPTFGACGTGPAVVGNDTRGVITLGGSSIAACALTFAAAYASAPVCTVSWHSNAPSGVALAAHASTTDLNLDFSANVSVASISYICIQ